MKIGTQAHHPNPEPYDQGGVRGADSLLYRAERADVAAAEWAERDEWKARAEAEEQLIPAYAMLDVWLALGRDSIHFDDWYDERGYADAWAELTAAVREAAEAHWFNPGMEQTAASDLYLDRNGEVWRRVHGGSLMRLSLGGYIGPAHPFDMVELRWGPLHELVPIERGTR